MDYTESTRIPSGTELGLLRLNVFKCLIQKNTLHYNPQIPYVAYLSIDSIPDISEESKGEINERLGQVISAGNIVAILNKKEGKFKEIRTIDGHLDKGGVVIGTTGHNVRGTGYELLSKIMDCDTSSHYNPN